MALKKLKIFLAVSLIIFILVVGSVITFGYVNNNQSAAQQGSIISQTYIKRANGQVQSSQTAQSTQPADTSQPQSVQPIVMSPPIRTRAS